MVQLALPAGAGRATRQQAPGEAGAAGQGGSGRQEKVEILQPLPREDTLPRDPEDVAQPFPP